MALRNLKKLLLLVSAALILTACGGGSSQPKTDASSSSSPSDTSVLAAEAVAETWTQCAWEGGICRFSGTAQIRYGLNGVYVYKTATGSIDCNNATFGEDPVYGATKVCEYLPSGTPPTDLWTYCAREYQTCSFSGTAQIRYGLNGAYVYKTATGSIGCNNETFGEDPAYGYTKVCEYMSVTTPPAAPVATNDSYSVQSGQMLTIGAPGVLGNDLAGSGGGALSVASSTQAAHGTVALNANGSFTYQPASGYIGLDSFSYTIRNTSGQESTGTVSLTVTGLTPPEGSWTYCAREYQTCSFSGTAQIRYGLNGAYVYKTATGSIGCNNETFGEDPAYGYTKVCDYMSVATPPAAPVATNDSYSVQSGQMLTIGAPGVLGNDLAGSGGGTLSVAGSTPAAHGTVALNANGSFTYQPASGYIGIDSFSYTIRNTSGQESTGTVSLTVTSPDGGSIGAYLDLANTAIAKYRDNKQGAASYTFDDGLASSPTIASVFESFGLRATFYINPGIMAADWSMWKQLAQSGHEVGNHTMSHRKLIDAWQHSAETLDYEINEAQRVIEQNVGVKPLTFAFPYNEYSASSLAVVLQNHIGTRVPGFEADPSFRRLNIVSSSSAENANMHLYDALSQGGWFCIAGHGVDGDGWEPVTSQYLRDHLTYAKGQSDKLWIDTYANVARYRLCRDKALPAVTMVNANRVSVKVVGNYSGYSDNLKQACKTAFLTVAIPMLETATVQAQTTEGVNVPVTQVNGRLLVNIAPDQEVFLQVP